MVGLMATSSKRACHTLHVPGLLQPEPLSPRHTTADLWLHRRHSNTQRQDWLSLCGVSAPSCTQGFIWALWASLEGMGFESKCDFTSSTILLGLLLCPSTWGYLHWWDPTFSCWWLLLQFWSSCRRRWVHILLLCHLDDYYQQRRPTTNTTIKCLHKRLYKMELKDIWDRRRKCSVITEAEIGVMWPQARECQQPLKAGRSKKRLSGRVSWKEHNPANTLTVAQWNWFYTFCLQNSEKINFCCVKSLSLWQFITEALRN